MTKFSMGVAVAAIAVAGLTGEAIARDQIKIVGSSTVFPFSTAVAEQFGKASGFPTPVVESTGSGGGLKLFCAGVGTEHPDITNASRRIKAKEFTLCQQNGVNEVVESVVGYDGIVVANAKSAATYALTREQLCRALVKGAGEPATWAEVDPSLPAVKIEVLGPPPSSGTRDAFEELGLEEGCEEAGLDVEIEMRDDGVYVDAGENDNLIVQKLEANPNALGVFGYSFPRGELGQDQRRDDQRRRADVRQHPRRRLPAGPLAVLLHQEGARGRRPRHHGVRGRVRLGGQLGQVRLPGRKRPDPAARRCARRQRRARDEPDAADRRRPLIEPRSQAKRASPASPTHP